MSAEQQKLLWIIAAVSLVIVIILAVGLWWFYPGRNVTPAQASILANDPVAATSTTVPDASGNGLNDWAKPEPEQPVEAPVTVDNTDGPTVVVIYADGTQPPEGKAAGASFGEKGTDSAAVPKDEPKPDVSAVKPSTGSTGSGKPAPAPAKKPSSGAAAPKAAKPATVRVDEYWIQTASVSSISRAEEVKDLLRDKGLAPVIMPITVNNSNFYRVRLGPYMKKEEAEKFLEWIKKIKSLEQSYISLVKAVRTQN